MLVEELACLLSALSEINFDETWEAIQKPREQNCSALRFREIGN